jgi:hypothetical protein
MILWGLDTPLDILHNWRRYPTPSLSLSDRLNFISTQPFFQTTTNYKQNVHSHH